MCFVCLFVCLFQLDVIEADLDGGYIQIPECVNLLLPPEHVHDRIHEELTMVSSCVLTEIYLCVFFGRNGFYVTFFSYGPYSQKRNNFNPGISLTA